MKPASKPIASEQPPSGEAVAAAPACLKALLGAIETLDVDGTLEAAVGGLLDALRGCQPGSAVALRLYDEGVPTVLVSAPAEVTPARASHDGLLFPGLGEEFVAPLPAPLEGWLHFAAPRFERIDPSTARTVLANTAGAIGLAVRLWRATGHARALSGEVVQLEKLATLGRSAASIVHELNNPLTAIIAYGDYLSKKLHGSAEPQDVDRMARIVDAAQRIQRYSRDLVDYSRPAGLGAPVDLHQVIDRALGFCRDALTGAAIEVELRYGEIPLVEGVDSPLTQVFVNLFTNAWHAMADDGGHLVIATRAEAERVVVEVSDDGPGIPEEHLARVFDAYFTTKPRGVGSGLGLNIVRQIVGDHGGRIEARRAEPRGATFVIELPVGPPSTGR